MLMRVAHSAPARIVQGLVGVWLFVEGSLAQGTSGLLMMAAGSVLIIAAGADVSPVDAWFSGGRANKSVDSASPEAAVGRAA